MDHVNECTIDILPTLCKDVDFKSTFFISITEIFEYKNRLKAINSLWLILMNKSPNQYHLDII